MLGGGGVDGAIHRAAGTELFAACRTLNGCAPGDAKITKGYRLPARHMVHGRPGLARRRRRRGHGSGELLSPLAEVAAGHGLKSIAFPAISTGVYGFPPERAAPIAVRSVREGWRSGLSRRSSSAASALKARIFTLTRSLS